MSDQPSYAVDVAAYADVLARVVEAVDAAVVALVPASAAGLPRDHAARLQAALAADAPAPVLGDLSECGYVPDLQLPALLGPLPPVVGVQVLAAYGLLGGRTDPWRTGPHDRLRTMLLHGPAVDLVEVERLLSGVGVPDAPTLIARALLQTAWDGSALAADWPAATVVAWVARRAEVLIAVHEQEARGYGYSRRRFAALLGTLDPLPGRVTEWLYARALGTRVGDRAESRALLAAHPDRAERCTAALRDRSAGVRASAASWLAETALPDDEGVLTALETAARAETDDAAVGALLDALVAHGRRAVDFVDLAALDAAAAKAAAKPLPASLAWLDLEALPRVRWADTGAEVATATVRSWVQQAVKAKSAEPGALVRTVVAAVDGDDVTALADALLHHWLAAGAPTAARGVLAVVALGAGERAAVAAADFVRTRAKQAGTQAQALVGLLARIDAPVAVQALVEAADSAGSASVRKAAAAEVAALAERRGWTVEQVGDRGAPTAGFDGSGRMRLDYGPRAFTAVLQPDLKVVVEPDDGGKARTSLPPARASDDADLVAEAKATLAAAKKTVTATYRSQSARLREALAAQRSWTVDAWRADIAGHPVLGRIATGLVWAVADVTFRPLDDGSLTDADDEPVDLDPYAATGEPVRLAHDVLLDPEVADAWRAHLADYEVVVPFTQLGEPLPPLDLGSTGLTDVVGVEVSQGGLHRLAEKAGFRRLVGDGGAVAAYTRDLPGAVADVGVGAVLEVRRGSYVGDWAATVELGPLLFAGPDGPVTLGSLPPVLLAEVRRDPRAGAGGARHPGYGGAMPAPLYDAIGTTYPLTRTTDPRIAAQLHAALGDARTVLNVGAGTGSYEPIDRRVVAVEPSAVMRAHRPPDAAPCVAGSAERLPFADGAFDAAMAVCTIHHWPDPVAGLRELQRVARRLVVLAFDLSDPDVFWLTRDYLPEVRDLPGVRVLARLTDLAAALGGRLEPVPVPWDCADGFYEAFWRRPASYLDERVRRGISVWDAVGPAVERRAVTALRDDLATGRWAERNRELLHLDAADLGARLLLA